MKKIYLIGLLFFGTGLSTACAKAPVSGCSNGWKITGYFTPVEQDYPPHPRTNIRTSKGKRLSLSAAFLKAVRTEGWGKTTGGIYIGYYHSSWHTNPYPLDALGNPLRLGSIATDKHRIPHGSNVNISFLPNRRFAALDIGPSIKGKHIDIFCGEGRKAEQMTFQVTRKNAQVCIRLPRR